MVLPKKSPWVSIPLKECHNTNVGGYSGFLKTYKRVARDVYWMGIKKNVRDYVAGFAVCQESKYETLSPNGLLQPLPISKLIWADVSMDFIERLPKSKWLDTILVVVDRLSKYGHFIGLEHPFTVVSVAEVFIREIVHCM